VISSTSIRCDHHEVVTWIAEPGKDKLKFYQSSRERHRNGWRLFAAIGSVVGKIKSTSDHDRLSCN
jgi:hypothetical protein